MRLITVAAFSLLIALAILSCEKAENPLTEESEIPMAPSANNSGALPHDGGCVAYCARAIVYMYVGEPGKEVAVDDPNFQEADWAPLDVDGDGSPESCHKENMCLKLPPGDCPEVDGDGDGIPDRCVLAGDGLGFWCRLMHGKDTH